MITVVLKTAQTKAVCPICRSPSTGLHGRYERQLADLPWAGIAVRLLLQTRKFFCPNEDWRRRIFCVRLPGVIAPHGRRILRLNEALTVIGFALGGRAGTSVGQKLELQASDDTLLGRARSAAVSLEPAVRIFRVDDWAVRRRECYSTILESVINFSALFLVACPSQLPS